MLAFAGFLFSGYLSSVRFFSDTCAFNEPCPSFLGYPACYFGFIMFSVLFACSLALYTNVLEPAFAVRIISGVSLLGILFAGYFTLGEVSTIFSKGFSVFLLGLPTCAWGLIVYILIFITSARNML